MDYFLNAGFLTLLTAPLVALTLWTSRERRWTWAALFLALLALDDLAVGLPNVLPALHLSDEWNWTGKILCILWALAFLAFGPLSFGEAGVTAHQRAGSVRAALLATVAFTAASFGIGLAFGGGSFDAETLAFQLTMPGIAEELVYRGVFIALLHRALPSAEGVTRWWPAMVTAVAFGLWHGLSVDNGQVEFDWLSASFPLIGGLAYGWLREHTGSVLFSVLAHNLGNTAALLGSIVG